MCLSNVVVLNKKPWLSVQAGVVHADGAGRTKVRRRGGRAGGEGNVENLSGPVRRGIGPRRRQRDVFPERKGSGSKVIEQIP